MSRQPTPCSERSLTVVLNNSLRLDDDDTKLDMSDSGEVEAAPQKPICLFPS